ncbi:Nitrilase [Rasamsonia emersonii CBS 393.64]|uniref:Nitrilase n=1 Tax=Rasamsonia emersonii (strain ATCC 16479 / CBS 393.64 / IMI 116815) TaxID=1408163 RepID=A0A0F4YWQ7_RASE3|nr:Nitrilase [Rasamsonia emersonii CBS 393.64]KKA22271.1 Nitrilase [Rasamsonia emersonii CBS 393.64]
MATTSRTVKVAAVQAACVAFDLAASLRKLAQLTRQAKDAGAKLVVFPVENARSLRAWMCVRPGRKWYARYYDNAVAVPSAEYHKLSLVAKENAVFLQVGIVEKAGATLYCTTLLFARDGSLLSSHRKLIPTAAERIVWGRGAGDGLNVVETEIGKIGGLICWENYMPAARLALYQQGVEIYTAPNADDLPAWIASMQHIAKEGRCFVISSNQFLRISDFPADYPPYSEKRQAGQTDHIVSHGGSCICGPLGNIIAGPVWDKEEIVYATLDMAELTEARMDFDAVGSYARPDIFELKVNTKPASSVTFVESED